MDIIDPTTLSEQPGDALAKLEHLEETSRFALAALDQAASLSDFSMSMAALESPEPILTLCLERVAGLLPFTALGVMLVDEKDSGFDMALCSPPQARDDLLALAGESLERGLFADRKSTRLNSSH